MSAIDEWLKQLDDGHKLELGKLRVERIARWYRVTSAENVSVFPIGEAGQAEVRSVLARVSPDGPHVELVRAPLDLHDPFKNPTLRFRAVRALPGHHRTETCELIPQADGGFRLETVDSEPSEDPMGIPAESRSETTLGEAAALAWVETALREGRLIKVLRGR